MYDIWRIIVLIMHGRPYNFRWCQTFEFGKIYRRINTAEWRKYKLKIDQPSHARANSFISIFFIFYVLPAKYIFLQSFMQSETDSIDYIPTILPQFVHPKLKLTCFYYTAPHDTLKIDVNILNDQALYDTRRLAHIKFWLLQECSDLFLFIHSRIRIDHDCLWFW